MDKPNVLYSSFLSNFFFNRFHYLKAYLQILNKYFTWNSDNLGSTFYTVGTFLEYKSISVVML